VQEFAEFVRRAAGVDRSNAYQAPLAAEGLPGLHCTRRPPGDAALTDGSSPPSASARACLGDAEASLATLSDFVRCARCQICALGCQIRQASELLCERLVRVSTTEKRPKQRVQRHRELPRPEHCAREDHQRAEDQGEDRKSHPTTPGEAYAAAGRQSDGRRVTFHPSTTRYTTSPPQGCLTARAACFGSNGAGSPYGAHALTRTTRKGPASPSRPLVLPNRNGEGGPGWATLWQVVGTVPLSPPRPQGPPVLLRTGGRIGDRY
jgi:hypothetical protein